MEKGVKFAVNAGCYHSGLWRRVALSFSKGCRYTAWNTKKIYSIFTRGLHRMYLRPHALAQEVIVSFLPSGKVLLLWMAVYSTARAWIFTGRTKRHRTSTSHKYLFSTFLPASAFIYWLFDNFVWLSRNRRHTDKQKQDYILKRRWRRRIKRRVFWTFSRLLLHSMRATFTHYLGSQSQLWAFFWSEEMQIEEWKKKKQENWAKDRKERLNSVLRDIT